ncbi:hypothetical protein F5Y16DRAFT_378074 [Xylariaceae sp. FL0255]|nr:hypothetical protein F5Y16DRAFT_378074 [Xylariaceae sp. FL0255]
MASVNEVSNEGGPPTQLSSLSSIPITTSEEQQHHHHHQQLAYTQPQSLSPQPPPSIVPAPTDSHQLYNTILPTPAVNVAHHGLQVLQAASAAPLSPPTSATKTSNDLAQQYAQSAALQMGDPSFSALTNPSIASPPPAPPTLPQAAAGASSSSSAQKVTRLRRACDMCSSRKVKCDESGPPCKPCSDLQVECTFNREMKRRGPPNKHAEAAKAAKRLRVEHPLQPAPQIPHNHDNIMESPPSPPPIMICIPQEGHVTMDAELIAPLQDLEYFVDQFFLNIHPLVPFPHEPSFRAAFAQRADRTSPKFMALLASMIGTLVASYPRCARSYLKFLHKSHWNGALNGQAQQDGQQEHGLFPRAVYVVNHCRDVALSAQGTLHLTQTDTDVDDAATSYFLGLAAFYTSQYRVSKRFLAQTMIFCRELVLSPGDANQPINHIHDQIGKRIFWIMVAGVRSMSQLGNSTIVHELVLPPPTTAEPYPDQPVEVDDAMITSDSILPQPKGVMPLITGFNANNRIYMAMNELVGVEMSYGINFFDWHAQKSILSNGLRTVKLAADEVPSELQIPIAMIAGVPADDEGWALLSRREKQYEIQKANIHASQLSTRSYFVERYLDLRAADPDTAASPYDETDKTVADDRELIVKNLLSLLVSLRQDSVEPNGQSIINKIRQVACTLVQGPAVRKGELSLKAQDALTRFIEILSKLEKAGAAAVIGHGTAALDSSLGSMGPQDEQQELRDWASLREYQLQFVSTGEFHGNNGNS